MFGLDLFESPIPSAGKLTGDFAGPQKGMQRLSIKMPGSGGSNPGHGLVCGRGLRSGPGCQLINLYACRYLFMNILWTLATAARMPKCWNGEMPRNPDAHLLPLAKGPACVHFSRLLFMSPPSPSTPPACPLPFLWVLPSRLNFIFIADWFFQIKFSILQAALTSWGCCKDSASISSAHRGEKRKARKNTGQTLGCFPLRLLVTHNTPSKSKTFSCKCLCLPWNIPDICTHSRRESCACESLAAKVFAPHARSQEQTKSNRAQ